MSRSHSHFLAMLPLFSILTMSPMHIESNLASRSIASEVIAAHPKYEARAAKIDRSKIEIDKDLDLSCFSDRGEALRTRLLQERKDYKVDLIEKDAVAAQKARIDSLVSGLVDLEVDMAALKEKKAWDATGEQIADGTMGELKTTLESLLQDEIENDLAVLKDKVKKEEAPVVVVKPEEPVKSKDEQIVCDLEEKNKVLSKQVEDLLSEQKKIMETMMGMSNMMIEMNQRMQMPQQQQYQIPSWLMSGSLVNPQLQYPYLASPTVIIIDGSRGQSQSFIGQGQANNPQMGQQNYQQNGQSGQFQYPQMPEQQSMPSYMQPQLPQPYLAGNFGSSQNSFNFSPMAFN